MVDRDLDIEIAKALGHYIERVYGEDNILRGIYNDNGNPEKGGSLAACIFKNGVLDKHRTDDEGHECWWESESIPNLWYTGAVPLYSSDLVSAFSLLYNHIGDCKFIIETNWEYTIKKYWCTILIDVTEEGKLIAAESEWELTIELAICKAFLKYKRMEAEYYDFEDYPDDLEPI